MFRPNLNCVIREQDGADVYGMPKQGAKFKERCASIKFSVSNEKSSVRADSSATRGNAREFEADALFLVSPKSRAEIDGLIEVMSHTFRIISKFPRHAVDGRLDHYEIGCDYWSDDN